MTDDQQVHQFTSNRDQWQILKPGVRQMRHEPTPAEATLWQRIRNRRLAGEKFRRQHTAGNFIVDFICIERSLIVEVDGEIHDQPEQQVYDAERQAFLESLGFRVLRFTNTEILQSLEEVAQKIAKALKKA